jgi:hypothetical protein
MSEEWRNFDRGHVYCTKRRWSRERLLGSFGVSRRDARHGGRQVPNGRALTGRSWEARGASAKLPHSCEGGCALQRPGRCFLSQLLGPRNLLLLMFSFDLFRYKRTLVRKRDR